jgi:hypothetical protein
MDIMIRIKFEHAYETGVILNKHKARFECDIPNGGNELRYTIFNVSTASTLMHDDLDFFLKSTHKTVSLRHVKTMTVFG